MQELDTLLRSEKPSVELTKLYEQGWLKENLPEVHDLFGVKQDPKHHPEIDTGIHVGMVLDQAAKAKAEPAVMFAALVHDLGKGLTPAEELPRHRGHESMSVPLVKEVCQRLNISEKETQLAVMVAREHGNIHGSLGLNSESVLRLFDRCDALVEPAMFKQMLKACEFDAKGRLGLENTAYPQASRLEDALNRTLKVNTQAIYQQMDGMLFNKIQKQIDNAFIQAIDGKEAAPLKPLLSQEDKISNLQNYLAGYLKSSNHENFTISRDEISKVIKMNTPGNAETIVARNGSDELKINMSKKDISTIANSVKGNIGKMTESRGTPDASVTQKPAPSTAQKAVTQTLDLSR